jgi:hypothetical protein
MDQDRNWIAPLTGVAFLVVMIVGILISGGEPPNPSDDSVEEIVDFYVDNDTSQSVGALLEGLAGALFVFFGGYLRRLLRDAEGPGGILSAVAFAGTIVFAIGLALDATITVALAETADDIDPTAVQALSALWNNDFVPLAMGLITFTLATGISIVRHAPLPKWMGWAAIVLMVFMFTPAFFVGFIGTGVLVAIISVMGTMRARRAGAAAG